ncbi:hypothetical protein [Chitinophaga sp. S165]|uniref:hypothetical protein n=1 Tax=Chitinophaga sp. S165 TaxID=2135462 RepID=UPI000D85461F|nr:hypothetical protein [Chitinophaga sp. S165]PWV47059.1 hypothetical protein C7475_109147 [Chitinophaga sp. S165]
MGYLKAGYSFRKNHKGDVKPTIYGPKPAVCFTEMPFNSFLEYTKTRNDSENVTPYGIAFHRTDLFNLGARPVIYGTSGDHQEAQPGNTFYGKGHRMLHSSCSIGLKEQYRYLYTRLTGKYPINWTHEREWR